MDADWVIQERPDLAEHLQKQLLVQVQSVYQPFRISVDLRVVEVVDFQCFLRFEIIEYLGENGATDDELIEPTELDVGLFLPEPSEHLEEDLVQDK